MSLALHRSPSIALLLCLAGVLLLLSPGAAASEESHGSDAHHEADDAEAEPVHGEMAESSADGLIGPDQLTGQSWSWTFDEAGSFAYHCHPHPWMTGSIEILPSDGSAPQTHEVRIIEPGDADTWTFSPAALTIRAGDTVVWNNTGAVMHKIAEATDAHQDAHGAAPTGHADADMHGGTDPAPATVDQHVADGSLPTRFLPHPASAEAAVLSGALAGVLVGSLVLVWMRRSLG